MAGWWIGLPTDRAVSLVGGHLDYFERSVDPLPPTAPIIVFLSDVRGSKRAIINQVIERLDSAVVKLYPAWLPGAEAIESHGPAARALLRALAMRQAQEAHDFANFLADLADRALTGRTTGVEVLDELRLNGLARLLERTYQRGSLALVISLPLDLTPAEEGEFAAAAEWLSTYALSGVWLVGSLRSIDRLRVVSIDQPIEDVDEREPEAPAQHADLVFPAIAGIPHPGSRAEQALERALRPRLWAGGRAWNQVIDLGPLSRAVRADLVWAEERCIVEIDGDEHRRRAHYAADRRRDIRLQLAGFAVLRFTNEQIYHDLAAALTVLERFLTRRRQGGVGT